MFRVLTDHFGKPNNQSSIIIYECVVHPEASYERSFVFVVQILVDVLLTLFLLFICMFSCRPCVDHSKSRLFLFFFVLWMQFLLSQFTDNDVFVMDHDIIEQLEEACQLFYLFCSAYFITCLLNQVHCKMDKLVQLPHLFCRDCWDSITLNLLFFSLFSFQMAECVAD